MRSIAQTGNLNMPIDWKVLFKVFIRCFLGGIVGYGLVVALQILFTQGFQALILAASSYGHWSSQAATGALVYMLIFAAMFGFSAYRRISSGVGFNLRYALMIGVMWGAMNLLFALFQSPGVVGLLAAFWQPVAMSAGAFFALALIP
jgi:hypothetical protein